MGKFDIKSLSDKKHVAEAARRRGSPEFAALVGALGAVEKAATDDSEQQKAAHYGRVLAGIEQQKLGEKHYGEIAELVKSFIVGPGKVKKVSSMNPSELSKELRHIASAIGNSKNPSKELVLKDIKRILASVDQTIILNKPVTVGVPGHGTAKVTITKCDYIGESYTEGLVAIIEMDGKIIHSETVKQDLYERNVIVDPPEYGPVLEELEMQNAGPISLALEKICEQAGDPIVDILAVNDGIVTGGTAKTDAEAGN